MEHYGGRPLNTSEITPLEEEAYAALTVPMLDEILELDRKDGGDGPLAIEYLRASSTDDMTERVGVVILRREATTTKIPETTYDVTIFHYQEYGTHALNEKDSTVYKIIETNQGVKCVTDAMYADGVYISRHQMNGTEHDMLLDELLALHQWQLAARDERDILNK